MPSDAVELEPSLSLSSPRRKIWRALIATVFLGAVAAAGIVVFVLVTSSPGEAACDHLDDIHAERTVKRLERFVSARVMRMKAVSGYERVEVSGCPAAMSALDDAMSFKNFAKLTACLEQAPTDAAAARCL